MVNKWLSGSYAIDEPYLPEYWWGWTPDNGVPLRAVVINLNPGTGNELQSRRCIRCKFGECFSYRRLMTDRLIEMHLPESVAWHKKNRENPLLSALNLTADSQTFPSNILCIESYPFHSAKFDDKLAKEYLEANDGREFWRMLEFAAEASRRIDSPLRNIVIIRISRDNWERIVGNFCKGHPCTQIDICDDNDKSKSCAKAVEYSFPEKNNLNGIRFICIWGTRSRNKFPQKLRELFEMLNIIKTTS